MTPGITELNQYGNAAGIILCVIIASAIYTLDMISSAAAATQSWCPNHIIDGGRKGFVEALSDQRHDSTVKSKIRLEGDL